MPHLRLVFLVILTLFLAFACSPSAQDSIDKPEAFWHGVERSVRYHPVGDTFVIQNGDRRFNRALYGGNTGFRVETGDLPEFALYMPRLGGTMRLGLISGGASKWLIEADHITAKYHAGSMRYEIRDSLLGKGHLELEVLALYDAEGMILRSRFVKVNAGVELFWLFGGASDERFHREGDIGADPESVFYLDPEHCLGNEFSVSESHFSLNYPSQERSRPEPKRLTGIFPAASAVRIVDASSQRNPGDCLQSSADSFPALAGSMEVAAGWQYFSVVRPSDDFTVNAETAPDLFEKANQSRLVLANRVKIHTPDSFINPLGGVLGIAADAIWESPAYHHGAIAWRQQLVGWRGAYVADQFGWHDRGREHFRAFGASQLTSPPSGPVTPDTSRNFARQVEKIGTAVFTEGYISRYPDGQRLRAHHYDMNQVYIDALLRHFDWTGDLAFVREMWPVIERHLAWEKRNFDRDGDGLYDAYASFWASDAVQYSGGGVAHASAYHYYSNTRAAELAALIGEDPMPYQLEAQRILKALNDQLWLPEKGCYAEFQDLLGLELLHDSPALWSIYHPMDSKVPDPFQAWQMLAYVDDEIPHIPVRANGLSGDFVTLSTSNWLPYTWSVNNVALAELMHTSLAFWQGGRQKTAFQVWKSALLESMYLGASPGSLQQLSFYDAMRGELYRDFADPIAMTARSTVEGLFGVTPKALENLLLIRPGFPADWPFATLETPDLRYEFRREQNSEHYSISHQFSRSMALSLRLKVGREDIESVQVNGEAVSWTLVNESIGQPEILIEAAPATTWPVDIVWKGGELGSVEVPEMVAQGQAIEWTATGSEMVSIRDPQGLFESVNLENNRLDGVISKAKGRKTAFVELKQGTFSWFQPICAEVREPVEILPANEQPEHGLKLQVRNNTASGISCQLTVAGHVVDKLDLAPYSTSAMVMMESPAIVPGTNEVLVEIGGKPRFTGWVTNWNLQAKPEFNPEPVDLTEYFNARVTDIFRQEYATPRPAGPTLQLPLHGIGNWCYPTVEAVIDDSGLRNLAGKAGQFSLPQGIPFRTPGPDTSERNILFTSQWDNYPESIRIPLSGQASHAWFLMAGTTNPMQSRIDNGLVIVAYTDGSADTLVLRNPDTWWPIEQDYYLDGFAFATEAPVPPRVHLKTGLITRQFDDYTPIKGFSEFAIEGGAATVLDLPLDPTKTLQSLTFRTLANDVVIGLMGVSLGR